jgi:cell division protein FtsL
MSGFSRIVNVLALGALVGAAMAVYRIKYESTWQAEEVSRLARQIGRERTSIALLHAEWAQLSRPDRIQLLAQKHLALVPPDITTNPRIDPATLPTRPVRTDAIAEALASIGDVEVPIAVQPQDDPIGKAIEAMGLLDEPVADTGRVSPADSGDVQ